jgi:hypothetical protein
MKRRFLFFLKPIGLLATSTLLALLGGAILPALFGVSSPRLALAQNLSTEQRFSSPAVARRAYPGGRDEDDLVVQKELRAPTLTVDRRSIELRVLKNHFKKTDAEIVAPGKSDEEAPAYSESE